MPARKLPPDDELIEMYKDKSTYEIAETVGVAPATVAAKLRRLGAIRTQPETWSLPGRHKPLATKEWFEQKYLVEKLDMVQIGEILNRDPKSIWRWMRKYGIPTRPRGSNRDQNLLNGRPKGYKHTPETVEKIRRDTIKKGKVPYLKDGEHWLKGADSEDNPNWKGGITPERTAFTNSDEWKRVSKKVWKRDKSTCRRCGEKYIYGQMDPFHIHHTVSFMVEELRLELSNLVLLCNRCHYWVHSLENVNKDFIKEVNDVV